MSPREEPPLTRSVLLRWLEEAPPGEQSAVIAGASATLGSLDVVYALLDGHQDQAAPR